MLASALSRTEKIMPLLIFTARGFDWQHVAISEQ